MDVGDGRHRDGALHRDGAPHRDAGPYAPPPGYPADYQLPVGYPGRYERTVVLADGRHVFVRPILPLDAAQLAVAFHTASAETLRRRFLGPPPPVTPALLAYLTNVDYVRRMALVAFAPGTGQGVGVARFEPLHDGVAEIAVVVDSAWRRVGLATVLIHMLAEAALDRDIHAFSAEYLAENLPVSGLIDLAGGTAKRLISQGIAEFVVELDRQRITEAVQRLVSAGSLPGSSPPAPAQRTGDGDRAPAPRTAEPEQPTA